MTELVFSCKGQFFYATFLFENSNLNSNKMKGTIPTELGALTQLKRL